MCSTNEADLGIGHENSEECDDVPLDSAGALLSQAGPTQTVARSQNGSGWAATAEEEAPPVNYDDVALVECTVDGTDYRLDSGKQGTSVCISRRPSTTWRWSFVSEARWDGRTLRARALERVVLERISKALAEAIAAMD